MVDRHLLWAGPKTMCLSPLDVLLGVGSSCRLLILERRLIMRTSYFMLSKCGEMAHVMRLLKCARSLLLHPTAAWSGE